MSGVGDKTGTFFFRFYMNPMHQLHQNGSYVSNTIPIELISFRLYASINLIKKIVNANIVLLKFRFKITPTLEV